MAFTSIEKTEEWDEKSLTEITEKLDPDEAVYF
jgi:hypothetical protein